MSANLSKFAVYVVDDNFFNGNLIKKAIQECQLPYSSVEIFLPDQFEHFIHERSTDVNDLFFFSTDMKGYDRSFHLARWLRNQCKKCQIAFYGIDASKIQMRKMNLLCSLGIIDTKETFKHQLRNLLIEAIEIKQSFLGKRHLLKLENKRELIVMDAESINYITTVKEERNQIVFHQKKSIEYIEMSLKVIKQMDLPAYFKVFKSYIINTGQIRKIDRTNDVLFFFSGEELEVGKKIRKAIG
ncbi:LytTR family DNA-binding domain-containing protein [Enterococcus sp.]|jgi:DNA-binding LytR/AlgR family response regulator|uniref:LytTR family DNA-binding domain-containing protein n=1 Tax=Enterococcus sp. TaxID=35783 RepID=UPI0025C4414C|nr:LytTR family DNA-binding domain-containing protein [Enterococcus sp.]